MEPPNTYQDYPLSIYLLKPEACTIHSVCFCHSPKAINSLKSIIFEYLNSLKSIYFSAILFSIVILLSSKVPIISNLFLLKLISNITARGRYINPSLIMKSCNSNNNPLVLVLNRIVKPSQLYFLPAEDSSDPEREKKT